MFMVSSLDSKYWLGINPSDDGKGLNVKTQDGMFYLPNDVALRLGHVLIANKELKYYNDNKD